MQDQDLIAEGCITQTHFTVNHLLIKQLKWACSGQ